MRIRAILLTNNEDDILQECVVNATNWADDIYIFDTGSTDNTWKICKALAEEFGQVKLFKSEHRDFNWWETAHEVYAEYFEEAKIGDWWCVHSTDEIYVENPRHILCKVPDRIRKVWCLTLNYYFTEIDLEKCLLAESITPLESRQKYCDSLQYYIANYSEPRFFKHFEGITRNIRFSSRKFLPNHRERILMRHLQYRSPEQINRRISSRVQTFYANKRRQFLHEADFRLDEDGTFRASLVRALTKDPKISDPGKNRQAFLERVVPSTICHKDFKDNYFTIRHGDLPIIPLNTSLILTDIFIQLLIRIIVLWQKMAARILSMISRQNR